MEESRQEFAKKARKEFAEIQDKVSELQDKMFREARETMRNLALVSGGIAAGALVLLGSSTAVYQSLVLLGVVVLMGNLVIIFVSLMHTFTSTTAQIDELRWELFEPLKKLLDIAEDTKISDADFVSEAEPKLSELIANIHAKSSGRRTKTAYLELIILGLFCFGVLMIGLGILSPHTCSVWGMLCE